MLIFVSIIKIIISIWCLIVLWCHHHNDIHRHSSSSSSLPSIRQQHYKLFCGRITLNIMLPAHGIATSDVSRPHQLNHYAHHQPKFEHVQISAPLIVCISKVVSVVVAAAFPLPISRPLNHNRNRSQEYCCRDSCASFLFIYYPTISDDQNKRMPLLSVCSGKM